MKKTFFFLTLFLFPFMASAKVNVVGTLPVFTSIAQEIGGDRIEAASLARGDQDPHFLDAKPTFVVKLSRADLLIHGGLELESGWLPPILVQARNPKINNSTPGNVDLSMGLHLLEASETKVDRSMGDVHPRGNPHAWLDPNNVRVMAANIAQHLSEVDPEGKDYYNDRLKNFVTTLGQKIAEWRQKTASFKGKQVITYHKSLAYFSNWTGLDVVANVEPKPGIPPSSRYIDELIDRTKGMPVKAILIETFYPKKLPEYLAQKMNIPLVMIPTDVGEEGIKNYFDLIDSLVKKIQVAIP